MPNTMTMPSGRKPVEPEEARPAGGPHPSERSQRALDWLNFFVADVETGFAPFISVYLAANGWGRDRSG